MKDIHGKCECGGIEIIIKEYGNFVYTCHCDGCRRINSGPVLSVDPGTSENVEFAKGSELISVYHDDGVERGFCSVCGTTLYWHNPPDDHYCMNAELFDDIIKEAEFKLELFYDMKPAYYSFAGERKRLDSNFQEIK